jgi:folate-binding protein YgfZ
MQKAPLYDFHRRTSAVFQEDSGWTVPAHFGNPLQEYQAAVEGVVRIDLSHHARLEVKGRDAAAFLHNLATNDVKSLGVSSGYEAFLCTSKARVVAHVIISRFPDLVPGEPVFRLDAVAGQNEKILTHLNHFLISEQVELADATSTWGQLLLAGPQAPATLRQALQVVLPELQPWQLTEIQETAALPEEKKQQSSAAEPAGSYFIRRRADLSVPAFDLWLPAKAVEGVWTQLAVAGVVAAGAQVMETLRLEAGTPRFGVDMDDQRFVAEVNRTEEAISYAKGCYLGQEPIVMARDRGHLNRLLLGLTTTDQQEPLPVGAKVLQGEAEVGQVTSSVFSPRLGQVIALAYLKRGVWDAGTTLSVVSPAGGRAASVAALPFVSP